MATRPAGTVIVLRARRAHRPGTPRRRLCRVYTEFTCWRCGKRFTSSVVAVYDPARYPQTEGVGSRVTPLNQVPKWHSTACKRAARRSPLRIVRCARPTCNKIIKTRKPNKKYHSETCRAIAYRDKRRAARPPLDPSFEFAIEEAQAEALAAMLGIDGPRQEMLDAARRVAAEVDAEAYERRLQHDPAFRESEHGRREREAQAVVHEAEIQQLRQDAVDAGVAFVKAMSAVTAIEDAPLPVSPAPARLADIDAELAAIAEERPALSNNLRWAHEGRDKQDLVERQTKLIERVKALESERPAVAVEAEAAPSREAKQRQLRDEQVREARAVEADAQARGVEAERRLNNAMEEVSPVGVGG